MKKLIVMVLLAAFTAACTAPEINEDIEAYGIDKDKAVNSKGSSSDHDLDNSED